MKKIYLFATALVSIALISCSGEDDLALAPPQNPEIVDMPIQFSSNKGNITRADITGAEAADLLGNKFVVSAYKGSKSAFENSPIIVFDNYLVEYAENTAYSTESNTRNWEYVGKGRIKPAIDRGITNQTIKYWDYSKAQYDFIAWSTGKKTAIFDGYPDEGEVLVSAITPETAIGSNGPAYTFEGLAKDLCDCYIADLVTVKKAQYGENPVTITFRSLGSKVRIGIYETVPGYSVKNVEFYSAAASDDAQATTPKLFTITANDIYTQGKYTVYFPTVDSPDEEDNNQAHVAFEGTGSQSTIVEFGALNYTIAEDGEKTAGSVFLGRASNTASYAGEAEGNYYTQYLPNEGGTNLNLRVNYTLESTDGSGEEIVVKGATAQVPSIYTQWKAGYAYTYLFKISDKTNGYTGEYNPTKPDDIETNSDPAGLFPITFDAVVVNSEEDATQETITTVSTPSITTYQKGSKVVDNNEYLAATGDIFVTVNDGEAATTPDLANGKLQILTGKVALYTLPAGNYTEADVVDALSMQEDDADDHTVKGRSGLVLTEADYTLVDKIEYGVDDNTIDLEGNKAMRFTPSVNTYAFVYMKSDATATTEEYQPVNKDEDASVAGLYRYALVAAPAGDAQKGVAYFKDETTNMLTMFIGQNVSNLYLDADGTQIASGNAVTGTDYYYTIDHGMTYKKATNIAYEGFKDAELYHDANHTILKTEETPTNGQAYYDKDGKYCVILPQQTNGLYVLNTNGAKVACASNETAIKGQVYFDMFTKNNGVYYAKVIKVE